MTFDLLTAGLLGPTPSSTTAEGLAPGASTKGLRTGQHAAGRPAHRGLTAESPFAVLLDSAAVPGRAAAPARRDASTSTFPARAATPAAALEPGATPAPRSVLDPSIGTSARNLEAAELASAQAARRAAPAQARRAQGAERERAPASSASPDEQDVFESHALPPSPLFPALAAKGDLHQASAQVGAQAAAQLSALSSAHASARAAAAPQAALCSNGSANGLTPARARLLHSESPVTANVNAPTVSATPPATSTPASTAPRSAATAARAATAAHATEAAPTWRAAERQSADQSTSSEPAPASAAEAAAVTQAAAQAVRAGNAAASRRDGQADGALARPGTRPAGATGESRQAARPTAPSTAATPVTADRLFTRTLATSTRLDQAARAGKIGEEQPAHAKAEPRAARPADPTASNGLPPTAAAAPAMGSAEAAAPRLATPAGPAAPPLPPEPPQTALSGAILPGGAHLRLESETLGDLALHLRVREGVAHLRVEGEQAAQLASRAPELQRALAAEGLQLGTIEVERPAHAPAPAPATEAGRTGADAAGQQGREPGPQDRPDAPGAPAHAATPSRRAAGRTTAHHVEA